MRRGAFVLTVLVALPLCAARVYTILPDGNGGLTVFYSIGSRVYAIPVDSSGVSHPERAVVVYTDDLTSDSSTFSIAATSTGWLTTFSNPTGIAYTEPLARDFSSLAQPTALGRDGPLPVVCSGDVCAFVRPVRQSLVVVDAMGATLAEYPFDVRYPELTATGSGFTLAWTTKLSNDSRTDLHVEFIDRTGHITGNSVIATADGGIGGLAAAPHPLGAAMFWSKGKQISAAVVRTDGTVAATATFTAPNLEVAGMTAGYAGGQIALVFNTFIAFGDLHAIFPSRTAS